ncbi:MAG: mechanosensitive ion channel [Pseudomonadota bacterium]|nr:mechanosensitive ion channel [Pseudomonadota bacterium]
MNPQEMIDKIDVEYLSAFLIEFGLNLLAAVAIFIIGRWIARALANLARRAMTRANVDETLVGFVGNLTYIGLLAFTVLAALSALGIQTTSFIAVLGAAGLAVGLALQGSLANFAAGVLMLIFRPFKLGDFVEAAGTAGVVEDIHIFTCQLRTPDNKTIIVPNGHIMSGNITNYSAKPKRRVDFVFGVGYEADIDTVKAVIEDQVKKDDRILLDDGITIGVLELADSSVNFAVRVWVNAADYWDVFFHTNEAMKKRFDAEGISIPFPQRDVHLHQVNA